jgi:riboflavin biosynthesis pyrimidine reductase
MVAGPGGVFVDESGSSRGISNQDDRELLAYLRTLSDVVVTGGETARLERYRKPKSASLAVITRRYTDIAEALVLTPPESEGVAAWTIAELELRGFRKILLEVGPSLALEFLQQDLVDEFCLTLTDGELETGRLVLDRLGSKLSLSSSETIGKTLFTIWRRGNAK